MPQLRPRRVALARAAGAISSSWAALEAAEGGLPLTVSLLTAFFEAVPDALPLVPFGADEPLADAGLEAAEAVGAGIAQMVQSLAAPGLRLTGNKAASRGLPRRWARCCSTRCRARWPTS